MTNYDSTDDKRTQVGNDTKHQYRTLSENEQADMTTLKDMGQDFINYCDMIADARPQTNREMALARTKMEEAVMWAVKGVTK